MFKASEPYTSYQTPAFSTPQKAAKSYGVQKALPVSAQSTFYTQSRNSVQTTGFQAFDSPYQTKYPSTEVKINDVKSRYERDIQGVQNRYEEHYKAQYELGNTAKDLEDLLELEKRKTAGLEDRLDEAMRLAGQDKRAKLDLERENRDLREKLRNRDAFLSDYEQKANNIQDSAVSVSYENDSLRKELKKMNDTYNVKVREVDEKYQQEKKTFMEELEELKGLLKEKDIENETKCRGLGRDLESKIRSLENLIREKDRIIAELNTDFRAQRDYNMKLKIEYEEELKRKVGAIKDDERTKYETTIKSLEAKCRQFEMEKDAAEKKVPELVENVNNKDKTAKDIKSRLEEQIRALKKEILDLQDKQSVDATDKEGLMHELRAKDLQINKAHSEINHLNSELQRNKDIYIKEVDRLTVRNESDQTRSQEYDRQAKVRLAELEKNLKESQMEASRYRLDLERFREKVSGNIGLTIAQTFSAYGIQGDVEEGIY